MKVSALLNVERVSSSSVFTRVNSIEFASGLRRCRESFENEVEVSDGGVGVRD